jgi:hypothetical protein
MMPSSIFVLCCSIACATTSVACRRPRTLESRIERFIQYPNLTSTAEEFTRTICGWPVRIKMTTTRLDIRRGAGSTDAAGDADFAIETIAAAPNATPMSCSGTGTFTYKQRSGSASHGPRGRDYYEISNIRRTNQLPAAIVRIADSPTTQTGVLDTWLPVTLQTSDRLPDMHPAAAIKFQIAAPGRYQLRTRPAGGELKQAIMRGTAYQNQRLLDEAAVGTLNEWQLTTGAVLILIDSVLPANIEVRVSAY